jgi:hypothetical protein
MTGHVITLAPGQIAIVGYGSLLSLARVARSLDGGYHGDFALTYIEGWRRDWSVSMPNAAFYYEAEGGRVYPERIHYLNATPAPATLMSGSLFVVDPPQLEALNGREWVYQPVDVTDRLRGVTVSGGRAILYTGRPEHSSPPDASRRLSGIRRSYTRMVEEAVATMPAAFRDNYARTTEPAPPALLFDDVLDAQRPDPWAVAGMSYRPESQLDPPP